MSNLISESDKRLCFVPCPHCGHYQHLSWDRFEYVGKGTCEAEPLSGVYFICEKCDRPIEEKYKTWCLVPVIRRLIIVGNISSKGFSCIRWEWI
ncbi:MAG: phage terminase large subunit family protein [Xenococcus sp. (in: cyanobacteria)]